MYIYIYVDVKPLGLLLSPEHRFDTLSCPIARIGVLAVTIAFKIDSAPGATSWRDQNAQNSLIRRVLDISEFTLFRVPGIRV